jgi:hypothetical protein
MVMQFSATPMLTDFQLTSSERAVNDDSTRASLEDFAELIGATDCLRKLDAFKHEKEERNADSL